MQIAVKINTCEGIYYRGSGAETQQLKPAAAHADTRTTGLHMQYTARTAQNTQKAA